MKKLIFALCLFAHFVNAQTNISLKRLDNSSILTSKLTQNLQRIVDSGHIAGLSVAVINHNDIVYTQCFGEKYKATHQALDRETIMYAASFTKPVFSYLFLKLVDSGVFDLDKPIYIYLKKPIGAYPKWATLRHEANFEKITPRMILSHSSGLPILRYINNNDVDSLFLVAKPTKQFFYSNEGMNLLGFVVEEYTGKTLDSLAQELIFTPLSMPHSGMVWHKRFDQNLAFGYDANDTLIGAIKKTSARGAGSMVTTATDYAQFVKAMLKKQGLSPKMGAEMFKPQMQVRSLRGFGSQNATLTTQNEAIQLSWGLGWGLFQTAKGAAFFHSGHTSGWQNYCLAYPEQGIAVVLMSNSDNFERNLAAILKDTVGDVDSPLAWIGIYDVQK